MNKMEQLELQEFQDFLSSPDIAPKAKTANSILLTAHNSILRYKGAVFAKLIAIHSAVSLLSLSVCHQFGMNPFNSSVSLSDYFMEYGHSTCMVFCGFLFIGGSLLTARMLLHKYEFALIRNSFFLQIFVLCSLSLAVFMVIGAEMTLGFTLLWILGAYLGSALPTYMFIPKWANA